MAGDPAGLRAIDHVDHEVGGLIVLKARLKLFDRADDLAVCGKIVEELEFSLANCRHGAESECESKRFHLVFF